MKSNPEQADFYVYAHKRGDTGDVFYIGKGRGKRFLSASGRNIVWRRVTAKHGFAAEIIASGLSETEAFAEERARVAHYRAQGIMLANLTDGGEGPAGRVFSDETKAKMRAAKLGRKLPAEHAAKIGEAHRGRKWTEKQKAKLRGRKFSDEHRANLSASATGRKMSREVVERIAAAKRGVPQSDAAKAKKSLALSGPKNPHFSLQTYSFDHPVHGTRVCTQYDLRTEFGLLHSNLSRVVSGERTSVGGWRIAR